MGVVENLSEALVSYYSTFLSYLPDWGQQVVTLFLLILLIVFYAWFIWKFYRFVAHKNIISLNLSKYNTSENPVFSKIIGSIFYLLEYFIILPFIIFFWFVVFTLFLIFLTEGLEVSNIIIISATIVGAVRIITYIPRYGQNLAKEVAKLLPFTLLAISITKPGFFDISRILGHIALIPNFLNTILIYLLFIIALEMLLRIIEFFLSIFGLKEPELDEDED
jgi:hypothetical protein